MTGGCTQHPFSVLSQWPFFACIHGAFNQLYRLPMSSVFPLLFISQHGDSEDKKLRGN